MAVKKEYYTPTQIRIAAILVWIEQLQEAITAYRLKVAYAKALKQDRVQPISRAAIAEMHLPWQDKY